MGRRKTTKEFKKEVYDLEKDNYSVLGEYKDSLTKILMRHNKCGYEYEVKPAYFLKSNGTRCPKCGNIRKIQNRTGKTKLKTTEEFKKEVYDLEKDNYTVLGNYTTCGNKILMKHNKCGYEYEIIPTRFISGNRCPKCSKRLKKTTESFKQEVKQLRNNEYTVLGEYITNKTKILMRHNKCGYEYKVTPNNFISKQQCCPNCVKNSKVSKGVKQIETFLLENNISYKKEFKIEGCKDKRLLPFDFCINIDDNNFILIEYDGKQHFNGWNDDPETLSINIKHDNIKNSFCKSNNIPLYRIKYNDNLNNILKQIQIKYNL